MGAMMRYLADAVSLWLLQSPPDTNSPCVLSVDSRMNSSISTTQEDSSCQTMNSADQSPSILLLVAAFVNGAGSLLNDS
jgi:hypothetical protein